jgi:hypothetical protein
VPNMADLGARILTVLLAWHRTVFSGGLSDRGNETSDC